MNIKYIWLFVLLIGFLACDEDDKILPEEVILPELISGSADFSNYVALGASFTAGYTDGAVFIAGQENSFPNILSQQFASFGGGAFTQPLVSDNIGGLVFGTAIVANPRLYWNGVAPTLLPVTPTTEVTTNIYDSSAPFKNVGVPGAKSIHINFSGYGSAAGNPYFARMASSPSATMLEDAVNQNPTFFTLSEIGGNDVLGYATSGGESDTNSLDYDPITPIGTFDFVFNEMVTALIATGAKGVVTNVPNITDLPHFTTVPHNPIPLDAATAGFLNSAGVYGAYNAGIQGAFAFLVANTPLTQELADIEIDKRTIMFSESANNAVVIMDENLTDLTGINAALISIRQATEADLFVLPSSAFIGTEAVPGNPTTVNGVAIPLADKWVLTPEEQLEIQTATDAYNATIASVASADANIALVDLNAILTEVSSMGVDFDGFNLNADLVTGGAVSLDGIHLTARGYAFMANKFLEAIDTNFGSNFIESGNVAKANDYPTNYSPTLQ